MSFSTGNPYCPAEPEAGREVAEPGDRTDPENRQLRRGRAQL